MVDEKMKQDEKVDGISLGDDGTRGRWVESRCACMQGGGGVRRWLGVMVRGVLGESW